MNLGMTSPGIPVSERSCDPYQLNEIKNELLTLEGYEVVGDRKNRHKSIVRAVMLALQAGLDAGFRTLGDSEGNTKDDEQYPIPQTAGGVIAYIVLPIQTGFDVKGPTHEHKQVAYFIDKGTPWDLHDRPEKLSRVKAFVESVEKVYGRGY